MSLRLARISSRPCADYAPGCDSLPRKVWQALRRSRSKPLRRNRRQAACEPNHFSPRCYNLRSLAADGRQFYPPPSGRAI